MKILIVGVGSIGQRHIKNLKKIGQKDLLVFDTDSQKAEGVAQAFKLKLVNSLKSGLGLKPEAVFICTPPALHLGQALKAAKARCHLFIEKPISHNFDGIDELKTLLKKHKLIAQIGCNLRFHPLLLKTRKILKKQTIGKIYRVGIEYGSYLPNWRPTQDYRKNYSALKSQGGGVILDDIHEVDYAVWLFGRIDKLFCSAEKISNLKIETEDTAELILKTKKGFDINIHMDYLQKEPTRKFKIICEKGNIEGDINKNYLKVFKDKKTYKLRRKFDYNYTYVKEIKDFIRCIRDNRKPKVGFKEAVYDLKIALAAKKSAKKDKVIKI